MSGPPRRVSEETLGAWVVKCDPRANPDVPRAAHGGEPWTAERWCVADNYRSRMMRPGHRAVLWVSGDGRALARGIWGLGWVTGPVGGRNPRPAWIVLARRCRCTCRWHRGWSTPDEIRAAGAADLEVLVQPHGSNPSWISRAQLARLSAVLGSGPRRRADRRSRARGSE